LWPALYNDSKFIYSGVFNTRGPPKVDRVTGQRHHGAWKDAVGLTSAGVGSTALIWTRLLIGNDHPIVLVAFDLIVDRARVLSFGAGLVQTRSFYFGPKSSFFFDVLVMVYYRSSPSLITLDMLLSPASR